MFLPDGPGAGARSSARRASAACRCATCGRARRAWRTCSCARSATRSRTDADLRAALPALRGARAAAQGALLADHARGAAAGPGSKRAFLGLLAAGLGARSSCRVIQIYVVTRFPEAGPRPARGRPALRRVPEPADRLHAPALDLRRRRAWSRTTCARARSSSTCRGRSPGATTCSASCGVLLALNLVGHARARPAPLRGRPGARARAVPEVGAGLDRARDRRCTRSSISPGGEPADARGLGALAERARGRPRLLRPAHRPRDGAPASLRAASDRRRRRCSRCRPTCARWASALFGLTDRAASSCPGPRPRSCWPRSALGCLRDPALARARGGDRRGDAPTPSSSSRASRWYGPVIALNDVTTQRRARASPACSGPNGAGKSTFLKLAAGQLAPSQGEVRLLGRPAWGSPEVFHRVGLCPEADAFWEGLTGLQFLTALLRLTGFDEAECRQRAEAALDAGRAAGREGPQDRRLQQGHAPAREAGPGPRPRPRGAAARRAGDRAWTPSTAGA